MEYRFNEVMKRPACAVCLTALTPFAREKHRKSRSSVFLCSLTPRKRLLRRLYQLENAVSGHQQYLSTVTSFCPLSWYIVIHIHAASCYTYFNRQHFFLHKIMSEPTPARVRGHHIVRFFWLSRRKNVRKQLQQHMTPRHEMYTGPKFQMSLISDISCFFCFFNWEILFRFQ